MQHCAKRGSWFLLSLGCKESPEERHPAYYPKGLRRSPEEAVSALVVRFHDTAQTAQNRSVFHLRVSAPAFAVNRVCKTVIAYCVD